VLDAEGKRSCARQVDDAFQDGTLTAPVPYSKAAQLPYLQACIKESLRLHPPISMELPRIVPEEGMLLCGKFVPGGTSVGCSPYIVHRQKEAYGEDAEEFRPERWIEADRAEKEGGDGGETRRRLERFYFTFGGSTTSCIVSPAAAGCPDVLHWHCLMCVCWGVCDGRARTSRSWRSANWYPSCCTNSALSECQEGPGRHTLILLDIAMGRARNLEVDRLRGIVRARGSSRPR
jgi:hypothetical protein